VKKAIWRAVIEVGFIVLKFHSNLLMGEFERTGGARKMCLAWAIADVWTPANFAIAVIAGLIGYVAESRCPVTSLKSSARYADSFA
jgi:hypothetical protein